MAKVVIAGSDLVSDSRPNINSNFTELYEGAITVAATDKTTPVDADVMPINQDFISNYFLEKN